MKDIDTQLLNGMLHDMGLCSIVFQPTNFWKIFLSEIVSDIEKSGFSDFRRHRSALNSYVPVYPDELAASSDYAIFREFDNRGKWPKLESVSESRIGNPERQFEFSGNLYSRSLLNYLKGLSYLKSLVDTDKIVSVLEIGGGYGTLGEILLKSDSERYFYVNVDIPPLAYISTRYLEEVFGRESVAGYDLTKDMAVIDIAEVSKKYKAMVLCSWQLPKLRGEFELFVNYISFQEMEPEVVENYAEHVNRLVKKFILLRNQRAGKQVAAKAGDFGVLEPVTREHYLNFFSDFDLLGVESKMFGEEKNGFASEVMVLSRLS